jgi:N-acetylglucosaminyl-diphospho-decaprenol L-rhamnosyltransferase
MNTSSTPDVSVVIVSWNTMHLLRECLASLHASSADVLMEIIVVDNASSDDSAGVVQRDFPGVRLIRNSANVGFSRASNQGIVVSAGRYVLLLNSDTRLLQDSIGNLIAFMERHPEAGACGPRLIGPDGKAQAFSFGRDPTLWYLIWRGLNRLLWQRSLHNWGTDQVREVDWVTGACLLARRKMIDQIGLLDENIFMYFEDNDWCIRMRSCGWKVYHNPLVSVMHIGGKSFSQNRTARLAYYESLDYFYSKHYGPLAHFLVRVCLVPYRLLIGHGNAYRH